MTRIRKGANYILRAIALITTVLLIITSDFSRILTGSIEVATYDYPTVKDFHTGTVNAIISRINETRIEETLRYLGKTQGRARYYNSKHGLKTALQVHDILKVFASRNPNLFSAEIVNHDWMQPSLIFKINSTTSNVHPDGIIVVGCHIDSINYSILPSSKPTGMDDNLSGVVTLLEAINVLTSAPITDGTGMLKNALEFHFYSGEELAAKGSHALIKNNYYNYEPVKHILAMLQQDMTGYSMNPTHEMGLVTDYASTTLNEFIKSIIDIFCGVGYKETRLDYAASDHVSSLFYGYPASYVLEAPIEDVNPFIHSNKDTIEKIDFNHVAEHVKLVCGFALELSLAQISPIFVPHQRDFVDFTILDFVLLMCLNETWRFVVFVFLFAFLSASFSIMVVEQKISVVERLRRSSSTEKLLIQMEEGKAHAT
ncbi:unnamed protein product [Ambrosiozyma monospora]|uniref:Peptide hydrolase n=1 Tax=Ambrosiozyma monospora TaxID=43982 RepID=A0A9W6Z3D8_AMBMO|nr:unnamed protein product [Ambrosiozyma monospora]